MHNFLLGTKILEEVNSPVNGKITVVKSLGFGTYIQVEGLTQSGGVVHEVWRTVLKKVHKKHPLIQNVLILGLGGGSAAKIVKQLWPKAKISGVDIDPVIVELGKKYLDLDKLDIRIYLQDALDFCLKASSKAAKKYDLILLDTYKGYEVPKKFETKKFLKLTKTLLSTKGIAVFNRLYFEGKRTKAIKFGKKLEKTFEKIEVVYPEANLMYLCSEGN